MIVLTYGWPHMLWEYTADQRWCHYLGLPFVSENVETHGGDKCPLILWKK